MRHHASAWALLLLIWLSAGACRGALTLIPFETQPAAEASNAHVATEPDTVVFPRPSSTSALLTPAPPGSLVLLPSPNSSAPPAAAGPVPVRTYAAVALLRAGAAAAAVELGAVGATLGGYIYQDGNRVIAHEVAISTLPKTGVANLVVLDPSSDIDVQAWRITIVGEVKAPSRTVRLLAYEILCDGPSTGCSIDTAGELEPSHARCAPSCALLSERARAGGRKEAGAADSPRAHLECDRCIEQVCTAEATMPQTVPLMARAARATRSQALMGRQVRSAVDLLHSSCGALAVRH